MGGYGYGYSLQGSAKNILLTSTSGDVRPLDLDTAVSTLASGVTDDGDALSFGASAARTVDLLGLFACCMRRRITCSPSNY